MLGQHVIGGLDTEDRGKCRGPDGAKADAGVLARVSFLGRFGGD